MEYVEWLKEQIETLKDTQDDFRYGMLKAFESCLEKYEESEKVSDVHNVTITYEKEFRW